MSKRTSILAVVAGASLLAAAPATVASATSPDATDASAVSSYIVVLKPGNATVGSVAGEVARANGGQVGYVYDSALRGFSVTVSTEGAAGIARNPNVAYVEADWTVSVEEQQTPTGITRSYATANPSLVINGVDDKRVDVDVAVIDTGIDLQHPDLNVRTGVNCSVPSGSGVFKTYSCTAGGDDDHYHGTHVAGTIGALDNGIGVVGVAPGARVWPVKVLDSSGSGAGSAVIAGINWVAQNAGTIEVANMSLGGSGFSQAEYDAIQGAVSKGVAFAVAAGNSDQDANGFSPGGFDNVLSVSALADFNGQPGGGAASTCRADQDDTLADFSNWGPEIDIAAPGVCILSTYPIEKGSYASISGTSMASPHVAGALALLTSTQRATNAAGVSSLYKAVVDAGNIIWTDDSGDGIKEQLLDVRAFQPTMVDGSASGTANVAPTVTITQPANPTTVNFGTAVTFSGSVTDPQDGQGLSLAWTSSIDGALGTGTSVSKALTTGTHTITASAADSGGLTGSATVTVTVNATVPPAPTNVKATAGSKGTANVSWSQPSNGGSTIEYSVVTVTRVSGLGNTPASLTVTGPGTNVKVSGLGKGSTYKFSIVTHNKVGDSLPPVFSNTITAR